MDHRFIKRPRDVHPITSGLDCATSLIRGTVACLPHMAAAASSSKTDSIYARKGDLSACGMRVRLRLRALGAWQRRREERRRGMTSSRSKTTWHELNPVADGGELRAASCHGRRRRRRRRRRSKRRREEFYGWWGEKDVGFVMRTVETRMNE